MLQHNLRFRKLHRKSLNEFELSQFERVETKLLREQPFHL
jgi:hypothetical protein